MPGPGTVWLKPVTEIFTSGDHRGFLKIEVEAASKNENQACVEFKCQVTNQDGKTVTRGTAEVSTNRKSAC